MVHETSAVDGTATLVTVDSNEQPWVVFTVDGGSGDNTAITKSQVEAGAFEGVLFNSYGNGGGPKIAVIARLNPENGKIVKGTFLMCRRDKVSNPAGPQFSGRSISDPNTVTNSISIDRIGFGNNGREVVVEASNTYRPPAAESTQGKFVYYPNYDQVATGKIRYAFPIDLSKINAVEILAINTRLVVYSYSEGKLLKRKLTGIGGRRNYRAVIMPAVFTLPFATKELQTTGLSALRLPAIQAFSLGDLVNFRLNQSFIRCTY